MTIYVADHAWSFVDSAALKAAGYSGDIGYCSYDTTGKNWKKLQIDDRRSHGLRCGINWETGGMRSLSGASGARSDGAEFIRQAKALGAIGGHLMVNLEDPSPVDPSHYPMMCDYARTMRQLIVRAGFAGMVGYGSDRAMSYMVANGGCDKKWVVETWPRGSWKPDLEQLANSHPLNTWKGSIDCNIASSADWGHALFTGDLGGPEVLDATDPIVQKLESQATDTQIKVDLMAEQMSGIINNILPDVVARLTALGASEGAPGSLSDADVARIAAAVLAALRGDPLVPNP